MDNRKAYIFAAALVLICAFYFLRPARVLDHASLVSSSSSAPVVSVSAEAADLENAFIKVADYVKPAVVNISAVYVEKVSSPQYEFFFGSPFDDMFEEFFGAPRSPRRQKSPQTRKHEGTGSGVIISRDGYILTNEHVIRDAEDIMVTVSASDGSQKKYKGKIVGKDTKTDIAVIKIAGAQFRSARLGDSDKIKVGQWVIAIGSPFGLEQTVTTGIVSAKRQALSIEGRTYRDLIQTDAAINRGNSGGPLCDISGEVVGINTAIYAPTGVFSGIGFAVPINRAKGIVGELIKTGKVTRGWLGVEIRSVDAAIEKNFKLPSRQGAFINSVMDGSPAASAGVKRGDVIIEFDGKKIESPTDLQDIVAATSPSKKVPAKVLRDGKEVKLDITVSAMPDDSEGGKTPKSGSDEAGAHAWEGMTIEEINDALRAEFAIASDVKGVVVTEVDEYSRAANIGFAPGDVIKTINNKSAATVEEFKKISARLEFSKGVVFDIIRAGRPVFLTYSEE